MENLVAVRYFVYIASTIRRFNINNLEKQKLEILLNAYKHGKESFMISGKKYWINNLHEIHIYEIDIYKHPLADILCHKVVSFLGEIYVNPEYFSTIGKEVTDDFITGEFGEVANEEKIEEEKNVCNSNNVFIVHGHDEEMILKVEQVITKLGLSPIILHNQVNAGNTIIEKFEANSSSAQFAIILLTADDEGKDKTESELHFRARQNVILEMGYFMGKLGRKKVFPLLGIGVEKPSDLDGIVYVPIDSNDIWKYELVKELKACGYNVDANKLI